MSAPASSPATRPAREGSESAAATSVFATAEIRASAGQVFDVLANPYRHREIDASAMVVSDEDSGPVTGVGDVFTMQMLYVDGEGNRTEYQTDNHVHVYEPNAAIGWKVAPIGGQPLGWAWRYDLTPVARDRCQVRLSHDWAETSAENQQRYGVPVFGARDLDASLTLLAEAVKHS